MNIIEYKGHDPRRHLEAIRDRDISRVIHPSIREWTTAQAIKNCETGLPYSANLGKRAPIQP